MATARSRWQHRDNAIVECREADGVALPVHQITERRRKAGGVVELRQIRAVAHRAASVDEQVAIEVRLLLELLDVVPIGPCVDLPIDRREIVAGNVLPVFGELDAEALGNGTAVINRSTMASGSTPSDAA